MKNQDIKQIHFKEMASTQQYLLDNKSLHQEFMLVSTEDQTDGRGQYGRQWDSMPGNLALSCVMRLNKVPTLTSLEVSTLIVEYFKKYYQIDLKLKWPNDILDSDGNKIGGVLLNKLDENLVVVGIGLNTHSHTKKLYPYPINSLGLDIESHHEAYKLLEFLAINRMNKDLTIKSWNKLCIHLNRDITFKDAEKKFSGEFQGVGEQGQALIKIKDSIQEFYSGSIIRF